MALNRFSRDKNAMRNSTLISVRNAPKIDNGPKNGPMIIGVVLTIIVMITLTFINIRLLSSPTPTNEPVNQTQKNIKLNPVFPEMSMIQKESKTCQPPTEVTFYSRLKNKEEKTTSQASFIEGKVGQEGPQGKVSPIGSTSVQKDEKAFSVPASSGHINSAPIDTDDGLVTTTGKPEKESSKGFVVQVGAFSHPRIAQEWASKWQAKGYKVTLKPVARPNSGIIYRLYLGDFESEKKADEFVKHLKTKEGISAMRLNAKD